MYNNVNTKIRRQIDGKGYSWSMLVRAVQKDLISRGLMPSNKPFSNPVMALTIRGFHPLRTKSLDANGIILDYARYVLKSNAQLPEQPLLPVEDGLALIKDVDVI